MMRTLLFICCFCVFASYGQNTNWVLFHQSKDIKEHVNKKFIFSAHVKVEPFASTANAQLFINILDAERNFLHTGRMFDKPIIKTKWDVYSLEGTINDSATSLQFGGMATDAGLFYFDNIILKVQEEDGSWTNIPIANSGFEEKIHNKLIRYWRADYANKNFSFGLSPITPDKTENTQSLLIKSEFTPNEIPVEIQSTALNKKKEAVLIKNITVIDVVTGKSSIQSVLIRDQKIVNINTKITPDDTNVITIDGTGKWLLPGLIDSHVHLFQSGSLYTRPDAIDLRSFRSYEDERKWLRVHAADLLKRYLQNGITSIIDLGGPMYNFKIRDRYDDHTKFPNIYLTGPLISTYQPEAFNIEDSPIIKANSVEEAIHQVQAQLPHKPDFIKIWYINDGDADLNYEIVKATIEESHKHNLKVAIHATELEIAKRALKAGGDILVHSVREPIDDEFIELIASKNVSYIPTLIVSNKYNEAFTQEIAFTNEELRYGNPFPIKSFSDYKHQNNSALLERYKKFSVARKASLKSTDKIEAENLKKLQQKHINIATGTDAGNIGTLHGTSYQEEILDMKAAGLTNLEIIQASTINAAKVLGKDKEIGSITVSKLADVIILEANPLEDIEALQKITHVMKAGSVYKREDILQETPENIVQKQVNAYNLGNVDMFLETYSDDIEIYTFPDILDIKGKEKFQVGWAKLFKAYPDLHCKIINRTVRLNTVIDLERVEYGNGDFSEIIAIYKIKDGKIAKVYFVRD